MNCPIALPSRSAPEVEIQHESVSPHLNHENMKWIRTILEWIPRTIESICGPFAQVLIEARIRKDGYLSLVAHTVDEVVRDRVDEILKIAMRASNGCCDCCDQPGDIILDSSWLTILCDSCADTYALEETETETPAKECNHVFA